MDAPERPILRAQQLASWHQSNRYRTPVSCQPDPNLRETPGCSICDRDFLWKLAACPQSDFGLMLNCRGYFAY